VIDVSIRKIVWSRREDDAPYQTFKIRWAGQDRIEVTVSPTGRSVQVYVDGCKWEPGRG